ncbi:hypothetical protein [Marinibacterium sp. SX1]|uniref:hypothetical protein n=1 Tax=Marinibacterium sp. SX1 TaxID=3388424 RepID=UPI003D182925
MEKSFRKSALPSEEQPLKDLVIKALWAEFSGHDSEQGLAEEARLYFRDKKGEPISARTIRYWLRGDTLPSALHLSALITMQPGLFLGHLLGRRDS